MKVVKKGHFFHCYILNELRKHTSNYKSKIISKFIKQSNPYEKYYICFRCETLNIKGLFFNVVLYLVSRLSVHIAVWVF